MSQYEQLASVNHNGLVVVFARNTSQPSNSIFYNVLGLNVDSADDQNDWIGFRKLNFPSQIRPAGMSIITLADTTTTYTPLTSAPIRVLTDEKYISVVRQTQHGTLLVNRFNLIKVSAGNNDAASSSDTTQPANYELSPVWEVRYARSKKQDVPADKNDTQNFLTPEGNPFYEPTIELSMFGDVVDGRFEVLFLPVQDTANYHWQFVAFNTTTNVLDLYNFPTDDVGLLDLTGSTIQNNRILPDTSFSIQDDQNDVLSLLYAPTCLLYTKHESVSDGNSNMTVKRSGRVMFVLPATGKGQTVTAFLDVAVSTKGTLAKVSGTVTATKIEPANYSFHFDGISHVYLQYNGENGGDNPLAINGPYIMSLWISPDQKKNATQWIICGDLTVDEKNMAPFIKMVNSSAIQVGFGNGSDLVSCQASDITFKTTSWYFIELSYGGVGPDPFSLSINGVDQSLSSCTTDAESSGTPVKSISSAKDGLIGIIDHVQIGASGASAVDVRFDSAEYSVVPPTTPNTGDSKVVAEVYGAELVPSSAPTYVNTTGKFNVDENGLVWYSGFADFLSPRSTADLLEGSDGLLHLYFQGPNDSFSVAHFTMLTERAAYSLLWNVYDDDEITESGTIRLTGRRSGTFLNDAKVAITDSASSSECMDMTISSGTSETAQETWTGVPRCLKGATAALNGSATNDPNNIDLLTVAKVFFDYQGVYMSVIATSANISGSYFQFASRIPNIVQLQSVEIGRGNADTLTISLQCAPLKWSNNPVTLISQNWPSMSANPTTVTSTFSGLQSGYDYSSVSSVDTDVYGLIALPPNSEGQASQVSIFVQTGGASFSIDVTDGSTIDLCNVNVCDEFDLLDVPRKQAGDVGEQDSGNFASVLNGEDPSYSYPAGFYDSVGKRIFVLTDGLSAIVQKRLITQAEKASPLAFSNLFRAFYTEDHYVTEPLQVMPLTNASILQKGSLSFEGSTSILSNGSFIFGVTIEDLPSSGGEGLVANTTSAPMITPGVNGGWIQESPNFAIAFNKDGKQNHVSYNVENWFMPVESLCIEKDMSLEMWLNCTNMDSGSKYSRALTYNVTGTAENPSSQYKYMTGVVRGSSLVFGSGTKVERSHSFNPQATTIQVFVKLTSTIFEGPVAHVQGLRGSGPLLELALNAFAMPVVKYMGAEVINSNETISSGKWTMLTVTAASYIENNVAKTKVALVIDDGNKNENTASSTYADSVGSFVVGGGTSSSLAFSANGASLWERELSLDEIHNSYKYGFLSNSPGLLIRWTFTDGDGTTVTNSAASGYEYNEEVKNFIAWDENSVYGTAFAARNDLVLLSGMIAQEWTHVSYVYNQGTGLLLDDQAYGEVSSSDSLNVSSEFSLEFWVKPTNISLKRQTLVSKSGSYVVEIDPDNRLKFSITVTWTEKVQEEHGTKHILKPIIFIEIRKGCSYGPCTRVRWKA